MNKERKVIEPNAIIIFDRDVNSNELVKLPADFQGDIVINGMLVFDEKLITIKCDNLYADRVDSDISKISIIGNLYTKGDIDVYGIEVNGSMYCEGDFNSTDVVITEDFAVKGKVTANNFDIYVGGDFTCEGSIEDVDSLKVLGKFKVDGSLNNVTDICIG